MPIRFRCPMCDGLLSTARRKAGSEVTCPKCSFEITVPEADLAEVDAGGAAGEPAAPEPAGVKLADWIPVEELEPPPPRPAAAPPQDSPLADTDLGPLLDPSDKPTLEAPKLELPKPSPPPPLPADEGITISRGVAALMMLLMVLLLGMSFATGYLVAK